MTDPHAELRDAVLRRVLSGDGETSPALRHAAASNAGVPGDLQTLVARVHAHAYRVTDDDVSAGVRAYGEDAMFEVIVAAALGASRYRLDAGLRALADA